MTGPRLNRYTGEVGEHRVEILLTELGFAIARPSPDPGVDVLAMSWEAQQQYSDITFYFQVKERRMPRATGVSVSPKLAEAVTTTPVLVFRTSGTAFKNRFSVCVLHRWLLKNRSRVSPGKLVWVPNRAFAPVTSLSGVQAILIEEAARVSGRARSLWRAAAHYPSVLAESEILLGADSLCSREPTEAVIRRVQEIVKPSTSESLFLALAELRGASGTNMPHCARGDPVIANWLECVGNPRSYELKNAENRLVRAFALAVERFLRHAHFSMPRYRWEDVNTWRILLGVYPAAFDLVEKVLLHTNRWSPEAAQGTWSLDEIKASLGLLGAAACSEDGVLSGRARALMEKMVHVHGYPSAAQNESHYGLQHAFYWALSQGDDRHVNRAKDFLFQNKGRDNWEFRLNRTYYSVADDSVLRRTALSRIENPRRRDLNVTPLLEVQLELVEKYGVVTAEEGLGM